MFLYQFFKSHILFCKHLIIIDFSLVFYYINDIMYKIQLTFTPEETNILSAKAAQLGYGVTKYVKLLIGREVLQEVEKYPTFRMSQNAIRKVEKAHKDYLEGKAFHLKKVSDLDKL